MMMTDLEAMKSRVSRRSYSGRMDIAQQRKAQEWAARANLDSGLSIVFLEDGTAAFNGITNSYGMFSGVHSLFVLAGHPHDVNLQEKAGHAGEQLVLDATKHGLGTCWVGGTFSRARIQAGLPEGVQLVAVITVGPVKDNKSLVEKAVSRLAKERSKQAEDMRRFDELPPPWFDAGVQAAALAPSAMNRQPVVFEYRHGQATAGVPGEEGHNLVDLGIAKLHFELAAGGRFELGNGGVFTKD